MKTIENTWEITRIGNPSKFMSFVLSNAGEGSTWKLELVGEPENIQPLRMHGLKDNELVLTKKNINEVIEVLPSINLDSSIIEHSVLLESGENLLTTYDNLSCAWLSKKIDKEVMEKASSKYGFTFEDTEA